jgi:Fe(3+) dicitrate transport protein
MSPMPSLSRFSGARRAFLALACLLAIPGPVAAQEREAPADGGVGGPGAPDGGAGETRADGSGGGAADASEGADPTRGLDSLPDDAFVLEEDAVDPEPAPGPGDDSEAIDEEMFELREVEVSYEREDLFDVGGSAHVVDEDTLETYEPDDVHEIVLQVPGVYVRQEDAFGLRPNIGIRGANAERSKKVTLMEDGVLLGPAPYSAPAAYYFPIVTRMVGLEVFKGPSAVMYGPQTIGGAVNLVTRDVPVGPAAGIDVAGGLEPYGKVHAYGGYGGERAGILFEGVHLQSAGFKEIDGGGDAGFNKQEFMLKLRANSDLESRVFHRFDLKLGYSREISHETYLGLTDEDFRQDADRRYAASRLGRMDWDRAQIALSHTMQVGDSFDLITTAYHHQFERSWRKLNRFSGGPTLSEVLQNPDTAANRVFYEVLTGAADTSSPSVDALLIGTNARAFVSEGIQTRGRYRRERHGFSHQLEVGLRLHHDAIERTHTEDGYSMQDGELVPLDADTLLNTRNRGETTAFAAYGMYGLTFRGLTLKPGLRTEVISTALRNRLSDQRVQNDQRVIVPGIGAHYAFTDKLGVLAGVHQGFSPVAPGQPDEVEPERSINYELGTRYSDERTQLEAIGFFNDYSNLIGTCTFSVGCTDEMIDRQFNAGEVFVWGLETVASRTFEIADRFQLPIYLTYTYTDSRFQAAFDSDNPQFGDVEEDDRLPYVPRHQGALRVGFQQGSAYGVYVSATYVGEMREEAGRGDEPGLITDDYVLVDVVGEVELFEGLRAYAKVKNITNTQAIVSRRPFGARPTRPLFGMIGLKYELP